MSFNKYVQCHSINKGNFSEKIKLFFSLTLNFALLGIVLLKNYSYPTRLFILVQFNIVENKTEYTRF